MRRYAAFALAAVLAACAGPDPGTQPPKPPPSRAEAPVVRTPLPDTPAPPKASPPADPAIAPPPPSPGLATIVVPADAIYVCVVDADGIRRQTAIEFEPRVRALCRKHPEMGPCQYERNACRAGGGRVYAAGGREITLATEAEYDKKVMRVRLKSN